MESNTHGQELVDILAKSDATFHIATVFPIIEVEKHKLQTLVLSYGPKYVSNIEIGLTLINWEVPSKKKDQASIEYYNLAAIDLSKEKFPPSSTINDLMKQSPVIVPFLRTSKYIIAEGNAAIEAYNKLKEYHPSTAKELANMLKEYTVSHKYRIQSGFFPIDSQSRQNLGMRMI